MFWIYAMKGIKYANKTTDKINKKNSEGIGVEQR